MGNKLEVTEIGMKDAVVDFPPARDRSVVHAGLRKVLHGIESGEVTAGAFAFLMDDGTVVFNYFGARSTFQVLGLVSYLRLKIDEYVRNTETADELYVEDGEDPTDPAV